MTLRLIIKLDLMMILLIYSLICVGLFLFHGLSPKEWQMLFNVEKCKVMHFGYNNRKADYLMDGVNLEHVTEEKDLGVIISEDLKWENSIVVQ